MIISDVVLDRVVKLASKGYTVRFSYDYVGYITVCIIKNGYKARQSVSLEEIEQSKFDVIMYAINRLVQEVDKSL